MVTAMQPSLFAAPAVACTDARRAELQRRIDPVFPATPDDAAQVDAAVVLGLLGRDLSDEDIATLRRMCRGEGQVIYALSIRQPYAWLILFGGKDIENRSWSTAWRGPLLIHAATGMTMREYRAAAAFAAARGVTVPPANELLRGGIVGQVRLIGCVSQFSLRGHVSRWYEGPWGWLLDSPRPLQFQPCVGHLRLFVPDIRVDLTPMEVG